MSSKVKVLTLQGTYISLPEWQKIYGLETDQIGKFFRLRENRFQDDLALYGELTVCEPLMRLLDITREDAGHSFHINSFNRDDAKQEQLKKDGFRAATYSPHVVKMGADIDTFTKEQTRALARRVIELGKKYKIVCRVGSEEYLRKGQTFVHVDVCPMYYAPTKPFNNQKHPAQWETAWSQW